MLRRKMPTAFFEGASAPQPRAATQIFGILPPFIIALISPARKFFLPVATSLFSIARGVRRALYAPDATIAHATVFFLSYKRLRRRHISDTWGDTWPHRCDFARCRCRRTPSYRLSLFAQQRSDFWRHRRPGKRRYLLHDAFRRPCASPKSPRCAFTDALIFRPSADDAAEYMRTSRRIRRQSARIA